jgi:hypothetical protein
MIDLVARTHAGATLAHAPAVLSSAKVSFFVGTSLHSLRSCAPCVRTIARYARAQPCTRGATVPAGACACTRFARAHMQHVALACSLACSLARIPARLCAVCLLCSFAYWLCPAQPGRTLYLFFRGIFFWFSLSAVLFFLSVENFSFRNKNNKKAHYTPFMVLNYLLKNLHSILFYSIPFYDGN